MPGGGAVPLRTIVGQTLVAPATGAIHLLATAIFLTSAKADHDNRGSAAEMRGRVLWTWNPYVRFAPAIRQNGVAPGHECPSR